MAEWTGKPMAAHRDADVYRFAIAQGVAHEIMAPPASGRVRGGTRIERRGNVDVEITTASAKRDGVAAMMAMAKRARG